MAPLALTNVLQYTVGIPLLKPPLHQHCHCNGAVHPIFANEDGPEWIATPVFVFVPVMTAPLEHVSGIWTVHAIFHYHRVKARVSHLAIIKAQTAEALAIVEPVPRDMMPVGLPHVLLDDIHLTLPALPLLGLQPFTIPTDSARF